MKVLGIDMGSREVKIAFMEDGQVLGMKKTGTMSFYKNYCSYKDGKLLVQVDKLEMGIPHRAVSTGYGRNNTDLYTFRPITEIKAHVYGALLQTGLANFILLDIGGQDVKVVRVEKGLVTDLELNDKCAAWPETRPCCGIWKMILTKWYIWLNLNLTELWAAAVLP